MKAENKQLFRQESLERLSSPEQLDQMMRVVNPKAWLPLTTVGFLVVAAAIWSVFGRIPIAVSGQAVLIRPRNVVPLQVSSQSTISELQIKRGDKIKKGQIIAKIEQPQLVQELEQEISKQNQLRLENIQTDKVYEQGLDLQRENLKRQLDNLRKNKDATEDFGQIISRKSIDSINARRRSLQQSLNQARNLTPTLIQRLKIRRRLYEKEKAISQDNFLQSKQQLDDNLSKISGLEAQIQENELRRTDTESKKIQNSNSIQEIQTRIQEIDVKKAQLDREELEKKLENKNQLEEIKRNIDKLKLEIENKSSITSPYDGVVTEVPIVSGQSLTAGSRIASIDRTKDDNAKLKSVMYFADKDGKQISSDMMVQITPSIVKRERFGGIVGKVKEIAKFPVTTQEIASVIGNEEMAQNIAQNLAKNGGSIVQIVAELETNPNNPSGFEWSSSKGPELQISPGTTAQVRVQVSELAPISFVIPLFRSWTGIQ